MRYLISFLALFALGPPVWAYTIDNGNTDVGGEDELVSVAQLENAGADTEKQYIADVLGVDATVVTINKTEELVAQSVDGDPSILATELDPPDGYYLLKNSNFWALFKNVALLNWAVFETDVTVTYTDKDGGAGTGLFSELFNLSSDQLEISHITAADVAAVPIPAAMWLFGSALVGMAAVGRQRRRA